MIWKSAEEDRVHDAGAREGASDTHGKADDAYRSEDGTSSNVSNGLNEI
jgi:hypothetical protein